jgi:hypothetical protein
LHDWSIAWLHGCPVGAPVLSLGCTTGRVNAAHVLLVHSAWCVVRGAWCVVAWCTMQSCQRNEGTRHTLDRAPLHFLSPACGGFSKGPLCPPPPRGGCHVTTFGLTEAVTIRNTLNLSAAKALTCCAGHTKPRGFRRCNAVFVPPFVFLNGY